MGSDVFDHSAESGVTVGSGISASETRDLPPFAGVELAGSNNVTARVGEEQSVVVHADDNLVDRITTRVSGGKLVIGNDRGDFRTQSPMGVDVTVTALNELALTGSGTIVAAEVDAKRFSVALSGSGVVRAGGRTDSLEVELNGSGEAQLQDLVARDVHAVVSGSGRALVNATETLDASVPGSGAVEYSGGPTQVKTTVDGVGYVTPAQ